MSNTTLHILNRGPNQPALLHHLLDAISDGDEILLIEDGIYWSTAHFAEKFAPHPVKVLAADAAARGITPATRQTVDDSGFVDLCVKHRRSVSWC